MAGRKRLEMARALATEPSLLLLDEVLAGLNPSEIRDMIPVVRAIRDSGVTILIVEHVMQAVMQLCDTVAVLAQGLDDPDRVVEEPEEPHRPTDQRRHTGSGQSDPVKAKELRHVVLRDDGPYAKPDGPERRLPNVMVITVRPRAGPRRGPARATPRRPVPGGRGR